MPHAIGFVDNSGGTLAHYKMLDKIREVAVASGFWTVMRYDTSIANRELILKGPNGLLFTINNAAWKIQIIPRGLSYTYTSFNFIYAGGSNTAFTLAVYVLQQVTGTTDYQRFDFKSSSQNSNLSCLLPAMCLGKLA